MPQKQRYIVHMRHGHHGAFTTRHVYAYSEYDAMRCAEAQTRGLVALSACPLR